MEIVGGNQNIKVICRVRPLKSDGKEKDAMRCIFITADKLSISLIAAGTSATTGAALDNRQSTNIFHMDYIAGEESTQDDIFREVGVPTSRSCLLGYNGTLICYGQTGTGNAKETHNLKLSPFNYVSCNMPL
jgi:hypothetical protein